MTLHAIAQGVLVYVGLVIPLLFFLLHPRKPEPKQYRVVYWWPTGRRQSKLMTRQAALDYFSIFPDAIEVRKVDGFWPRTILCRHVGPETIEEIHTLFPQYSQNYVVYNPVTGGVR